MLGRSFILRRAMALLFISLCMSLPGAAQLQQWVARHNGSANLDDGVEAIRLDAQGYIYVTGNSAGATTGYDFTTARYDDSGHELWLSTYDGPASGNDRAWDIALDSSGNVIV